MKILELFKQFDPCETKLYEPYIIAEAGVNHEGSMEIAKRLIYEAKEGGADAIKFQTIKLILLQVKILLLIGTQQKNLLKVNMNFLKSMILFGKMKCIN